MGEKRETLVSAQYNWKAHWADVCWAQTLKPMNGGPAQHQVPVDFSPETELRTLASSEAEQQWRRLRRYPSRISIAESIKVTRKRYLIILVLSLASSIPFGLTALWAGARGTDCSLSELKVHSVAWNCIGTKLASGSVDQTARVWHIEPHGHVSALPVTVKGTFFFVVWCSWTIMAEAELWYSSRASLWVCVETTIICYDLWELFWSLNYVTVIKC